MLLRILSNKRWFFCSRRLPLSVECSEERRDSRWRAHEHRPVAEQCAAQQWPLPRPAPRADAPRPVPWPAECWTSSRPRPTARSRHVYPMPRHHHRHLRISQHVHPRATTLCTCERITALSRVPSAVMTVERRSRSTHIQRC